MIEFPKMMYRPGKQYQLAEGSFDTLIANDEAEKDAAQAAGWRLTPAEAAAKAPIPDDDAPATREELETKAAELGIKFDGRTSDAKLAAKISAELKD